MFRTLISKEFLEQRRTSKVLVMFIVFFVVGLISPLLAKYTPVLLRMVPDLPADFAALIPEPTLTDAIGQYLKNANQFGILLVLVLTMGLVAQEKERGTAAMLLIKPIRRSSVVLAKWAASMGVLLASLVIAATACYIYTALLFEPLPVGEFALLNVLLWAYLSVYLTVALLASTLARSQTMAAAGAFGGLVILLILGAIPRVNDFMPGKLLEWGAQVVLGGDKSYWSALIA
ncbi:MAG: hypothetical protein EHM70_06775, partial [Chloroflexota bacterium]